MDDTLIIASSLQMLQTVKGLLSLEFSMTDLGQLSFFLGVQAEINKEIRIISIHQKHYIRKLLEKIGMLDAKSAITPEVAGLVLSKEHAPKNEEERKQMEAVPYLMLVGCLLWISNWTRPDVEHATSCVLQYLADPGQVHWVAAKRILCYLKGMMELGLQYCRSPKQEKLELATWTDANWAADRDTRRSVLAYCIKTCGCVVVEEASNCGFVIHRG